MNSPPPAAQFSHLGAHLHDILRVHPGGLSEYELLNLLREHEPIFQGERSEPLSLFHQHFILFHTLYRLEQELVAKRQAQLQISPLQIVLRPYHPGTENHLSLSDPLRSYYLDVDHLYQTGADEVDSLLNNFWQHLVRTERREEALRILGLVDPIDDASIRRRYRELVMIHHPDRGGETARLQLLNNAVATLLPGKD